MRTKHSEVLGLAVKYWQSDPNLSNAETETILGNLAPGAFTQHELAEITRIPLRTIRAHKAGLAARSKLNPATLDILAMIALDWETNETIRHRLVSLAVRNGTSMETVSRLTAVPRDKLREGR